MTPPIPPTGVKSVAPSNTNIRPLLGKEIPTHGQDGYTMAPAQPHSFTPGAPPSRRPPVAPGETTASVRARRASQKTLFDTFAAALGAASTSPQTKAKIVRTTTLTAPLFYVMHMKQRSGAFEPRGFFLPVGSQVVVTIETEPTQRTRDIQFTIVAKPDHLGAWGPMELIPKADRQLGLDARRHPLPDMRIVQLKYTTVYDAQWSIAKRQAVISLLGANEDTGAIAPFSGAMRLFVKLVNGVDLVPVAYRGTTIYEANVTETFNLMARNLAVQKLTAEGTQFFAKRGIPIEKGSPTERLAYLYRILSQGLGNAKPGGRYELEIKRARRALNL